MTKKNHTRFSLSKKPPQTPTLFPLIVNHKISHAYYFNINNKYLWKNTNNSKLIVQKTRCKNLFYTLYKKSETDCWRLEYLLDKNSIIYITRIFREETKNTPKKTEIENNISDYLWTASNFSGDYNSEDDQRPEIAEGTSEKNPVTQEDELWDTEEPKLSRYIDSPKYEIFDVTKLRS